MNYYYLFLVLMVPVMQVQAMEKRIIEGELSLLPEPLALMSEEEQALFSLTPSDLDEDKLGVSVSINSWSIEAKKGMEYLLKNYAALVLTETAQKILSGPEQCDRIRKTLEDWSINKHPIIAGTRDSVFLRRIPFNLITQGKLQQLADGQTPADMEIQVDDEAVVIKLSFAQDTYAYGGETSCADIAKALLSQWGRWQMEEDEKLAKKIEAEEWQTVPEQYDDTSPIVVTFRGPYYSFRDEEYVNDEIDYEEWEVEDNEDNPLGD